MSAPGTSPWPSGVLFGLMLTTSTDVRPLQDRQRVAHRARRLPARIPRDDDAPAERRGRTDVRNHQHRPPGRQHDLLGRWLADVGRLIRVHLSQDDKIGVAGVHTQHARERRVERVVGPGLIGDAAALCRLPKALESGLGLRFRLGIHARPDVPRNLLPDVVQQRDLDDRIDAREMGAVLPRQPDGGIDALRAALAVVEITSRSV